VSNEMMAEAIEQITALLRQRHRLPGRKMISYCPGGRGLKKSSRIMTCCWEHRVHFVGRRHRHHEYHAVSVTEHT
jgi:hypothetical protein